MGCVIIIKSEKREQKFDWICIISTLKRIACSL
jgi:hypothetical protein